MKTYLSLILLLLWFNGNCQDDFDRQYNLIKANIQRPFETIRTHISPSHMQVEDSFFVDYVLKKYSSQKQIVSYISNKYFLKKFSDIILKQNIGKLFLASTKNIEINIETKKRSLNTIGEIQYDSTDFGEGIKKEYDIRYIRSVNEQKIYGLRFDTAAITQIAYISIKINNKEYLVNDEILNDLFFPNICESDYAIKPIEAFLSPNEKCIYLYLFGGQESSKYFCKIIFDIENKTTVGRMIVDAVELSAYHCLSAKKFIGF